MDLEMSKAKRAAEAKSDLIGWLFKSDMFDLLGFDNSTSDGERRAWDAFAEKLKYAAAETPVLERNRIEDLAHAFGNEREETGFRIGFHVAMKLCMEGLAGGIR